MGKYNQVQGESALAYEYFKIYRDMPSSQRSLRALCDYQVFGRKRSQSVFTRWSVKHNWQERVRVWDVQRSREALSEVIIQRNKELIDFINEDFSIAKRAQNIAKRKLTELEGSGELNAHQYRHLQFTPIFKHGNTLQLESKTKVAQPIHAGHD